MGQQHLKLVKITSEEDFHSFLQQFSSSGIIKSAYKISKEVYFNGCSIDSLKRFVTVKDVRNGLVSKQCVLIQPWQFADLIYKSILYSNDYKGVINLTDDMFLLALEKTKEYISFVTSDLIKELHSEFDVSLFIYGFGGEQFKYENQFLLFFQNLIRELYIIFTITKKYKSVINPEEIVKQEIGVEWKDLILVLFSIFIDSLFHQDINETINNLTFDPSKNKDEIFKKVTDYYSADYNTIRNNNNLGRQIFYVKPYIKTQRNGLLTASVYFNKFIVEHAVFWIIRNYFLNKEKKEKQEFTNEFGHLFEYYLEELFMFYKVNYKKVCEGEKKRTDWHIIIDHYDILIEQKSSILPISIKQQLTDFEAYKKEVRKIIYKALKQLETTEKDLSINKPIKIILCYDNYINENILPHVFKEDDCQVVDDGRYFISNIMEIEMFIELASTNYSLFETVIKDMLRRNTKDNKEGISILKIMQDNGYNNNSYWNSSIFDDYKNLLKDIKDRHKLFKDK